MKIEIESEKDNPFLERKEISVKIYHEGQATPSIAALQKVVSAELGKDPVHVDIRHIFSRLGIGHSRASVFVWKEPKVKDLAKEAQEKASAGKESAKEEPVPKEEKADEKPEKKEQAEEAGKE